MGGKLFPVPWQAGQVSGDNMKYVVNMQRGKLQDAPSFARDNWPDLADDQVAVDAFKHYNQTPYWMTGPEAKVMLSSYGTNNTALGSAQNPNAGVQAGQAAQTGQQLAPGQKNLQATNDHVLWFQRPQALRKLTELKTLEVRNSEGSSLGRLTDLVMDPDSGRIMYGIQSDRGKLLPVPWSAYQLNEQNNLLVLAADQNRLKDAPAFDKNRWPNMVDPQWASDVYGFYNVTPFWQSGQLKPTIR
jgi:hypothetical protein